MQGNNNILLVANWDSDVGYAWWLMENFWATIANHFNEKGCKCFLIYPSISKIPKIIADSPITIIEHDYSDLSKLGQSKLKKIIVNNNIGNIYLSDKPEVSLCYMKLKLWGVKKIFVHDHTPGDRPAAKGLRKVFKLLYKRLPLILADVYIAVTPFIKGRMIHSGCLPERKCHVAQNGIFPIQKKDDFKHYCHDAFQLPHDSILIISTGRASVYKQIDFMIEVFARICNEAKIDNIYFVYCGDGEKLVDFKHLASKKKLDGKFIFAGQRDDVNKLLQSCDIGIQASKGEVGYSLSILEYMSAGLATLVPDRPSTCQSIEHDFDGVIFKHESIDDAYEKLLTVIKNKNYRDSLGLNAENSVIEKYNILDTNKQLIKILSQEIH